ncbi:MAG TPA: D-Ala-D-Ala carboxypeptidase family metallohydrolase, partial [Gemmatimonadaceae bacterium]|nr:D-Ala-D-Ala carboxypeptidase family metallohydrolase [Gemmatimonadaceae bacterium]
EKLEAVITELGAAGVRGADMRVLSGFRAPHHNAGVEGAAPSSRHQFGDAADVVVDADGDGRMDDLNGDGRVDRADILVVAGAVERVERRRPDLVGGLGLYEAQGPSGPFLHIDVRGTASRWGTALGAPQARTSRPAVRWTNVSTPTPTAGRARTVKRPGCRAEGEFAEILCAERDR